MKVLVHTDVTRYLDFKQVDGSYVYRAGQGIHKVPVNGSEAMATSLVGFFQKLKLRSFLEYVAHYNAADPATHKGASSRVEAAGLKLWGALGGRGAAM